MFDFTNVTFSGLISIFGALVSLGYPVVLQSIQRIDEQYDSIRLTHRLQYEIVFKLFKCLMIVNIIVSILAPFVLYLLPIQYIAIVITVQSVMVLALLLCSVKLFNLILAYYYPQQLIKRLKDSLGDLKKKSDRLKTEKSYDKYARELMNMLDISIYAARKKNRETYHEAYCFILRAFIEYNETVEVGEDVIYPRSYMKILEEIKRYTTDLKEPTFFYYSNEIIPILYDSTSSYKISENTFVFIWSMINDVILADNRGWFSQYWSWSDQYYRFALTPIMRDDKKHEEEEEKRFYEQHVMIGALLIYNKKYEWLRDIMYFTDQEPPKYYLIPGTFSKIFDMVLRIDKLASFDASLHICARYPFKGMNADVRTAYYIQAEVMKYLSLLLIRVFLFDDYNIGYCNPKEYPPLADHILKNKEYKFLVESLKNRVNEWYDSEEINKIGFKEKLPSKESVFALLDGYIGKIEEETRKQECSVELSSEKINEVKQRLKELEGRFFKQIVTYDLLCDEGDEIKYDGKETDSMLLKFSIDKGIVCRQSEYCYCNFEESLIEAMIVNFQRYYSLFFIKNKSSADYVIQYDDIFKAIDKLQVSSGNYIVFMQGVYLHNFEEIYGKVDGLELQENGKLKYKQNLFVTIPSPEQSLLVIPKADVPFWEILKEKDSRYTQLSLIDNDSYLYTNLDMINENGFIMKAYYHFNFNYKKSFKYVRLKVTYNLSMADSGDLDAIEPFV